MIASENMNIKTDNNDPGISAPVIEMLTLANEYCLFFEKAESYKTPDILEYFRKLAPMLYLKASLLPEIQNVDEESSERFVTEEQWETVFKTLREKFGKTDVYHLHDHNFDSVEASLSDNMADIYQDMKDFVMLYQKNTTPARHNAIANLVNLYAWRWGPALLNALATVHQTVFRDKIDPDILGDNTDW